MLRIVAIIVVAYITFAALSLNTLVSTTKHNAAARAALMDQ